MIKVRVSVRVVVRIRVLSSSTCLPTECPANLQSAFYQRPGVVPSNLNGRYFVSVSIIPYKLYGMMETETKYLPFKLDPATSRTNPLTQWLRPPVKCCLQITEWLNRVRVRAKVKVIGFVGPTYRRIHTYIHIVN